MFAGIAQRRGMTLPRHAASMLLAVLLNIALVPCAMALEAADESHDCCPPKLELQKAECCDLDAVAIDTRGAVLDPDEGYDVVPALPPAEPAAGEKVAPPRHAAKGPPGPRGPSVAIHKLHCVYLN